MRTKFNSSVFLLALSLIGALASPGCGAEREIANQSRNRSPHKLSEGEAHRCSSTAQSFGDITAVPTLFLFDRSGKTSRVLYGAPPDLHDQVEKSLDSLLQSARSLNSCASYRLARIANAS